MKPCDAGAATRREAMQGALIFGAAQRTRILAALLEARPGGLTADELEERLSMSGNSVRPRLRELLEAGQVTRTDRTRRTRSGSLALVCVVSEVAP